jgi:hypothetical protein
VTRHIAHYPGQHVHPLLAEAAVENDYFAFYEQGYKAGEAAFARGNRPGMGHDPYADNEMRGLSPEDPGYFAFFKGWNDGYAGTRTSSRKTATGEMSAADLTLDGEWGFLVEVAEDLGGTIYPFDKYQGPYIMYKGNKFWFGSDGQEDYIYNETTGEFRPFSVWQNPGYAANEIREMVGERYASRKQSRKTATQCSCAYNTDGTVTTMLCPQHADEDPCATKAAVTGRRRRGSIINGVCSACGWSEKGRTASRKTASISLDDLPNMPTIDPSSGRFRPSNSTKNFNMSMDKIEQFFADSVSFDARLSFEEPSTITMSCVNTGWSASVDASKDGWAVRLLEKAEAHDDKYMSDYLDRNSDFSGYRASRKTASSGEYLVRCDFNVRASNPTEAREAFYEFIGSDTADVLYAGITDIQPTNPF